LEEDRAYRKNNLLESLGENQEDKLLEVLFDFDRKDFSHIDKYMDIMEMDPDDLDQVEYMEADEDNFGSESLKENKYYDAKESLPRYNLKSVCLDLLAETGTRKTVDYIIAFIESSEHSMLFAYRDEIIKILNKIDADYARQKLQGLAGSKKSDVRERAGYFLKMEEIKAFKKSWLDNHLDGAPEDEKRRLMEFLERYGDDGLKCLVVLGEKEGMEEKILKVGLERQLAHQEAYMLFAKMAELSDKTEDELVRLLDNDQIGAYFSEARYKLLERASEFIEKFLGHDIKNEDKVIKLLNDLENSKIQIDLLSALLKTAKEQGLKLTPEMIRGMKMESHDVGELTGEKKAEFREKFESDILAMAEAEYRKVFLEVENPNQEAYKKVMNNFRERLQNIEQHGVHALTFQGEMLSVMTMRPEEDGVMAESFVVHPEAKNYSLALAFARVIMKQESAKKAIFIKVRKDNESIIRTHEKMGFVVTEEPLEPEFGVKYVKMRLEEGEFKEKA
jgi:hypothetical protein